MANFFTRRGDDGYTSVLGEGRVPKYHSRPEAVGTIDEASAAIGVARAFCISEKTSSILLEIQRDLYHIMAETSATPENAAQFREIDEVRVNWLEAQTEMIAAAVEIPGEFILPGDSRAGGLLSLARTVVRRAERRIAELRHNGDLENTELLRYMNRLSSLCFVLELFENQAAGASGPTLAREDPE